MFQRLADRWKRRALHKQRNIFEYFDGIRTRRIDPFVVQRLLDTHEKFHWEIGFDVDRGDLEAEKVTVDATREVFDIPLWDEDNAGLTDTETMSVLYEYVDYLDRIKKKFNLGQMPQPPTGSESSTSKDPPPETTKHCSD